MCSMPGGISTQECMRSSYTEKVGAGNVGSANAPTVMMMLSSRSSLRKYTVAPHVRQKWNVLLLPPSPTRTNVFEVPAVVTDPAGNRACAANTLPDLRWQSRQWQTETPTGAADVVAVSRPQAQLAIRFVSIILFALPKHGGVDVQFQCFGVTGIRTAVSVACGHYRDAHYLIFSNNGFCVANARFLKS